MLRLLYYLVLTIFYLFWDSIKACLSVCFRRRSHHDFSKDICLVTGAAQGVGRLFAKELATRRAVLVLLDIQEEKLEQVVNEISTETGADVHGYVCDLSKREDIYRVAQKVREEVGDVSVLINNAAVMTGRPLLENKDEDIERTFKINTLAHFWVNYSQVICQHSNEVAVSCLFLFVCIVKGELGSYTLKLLNIYVQKNTLSNNQLLGNEGLAHLVS